MFSPDLSYRSRQSRASTRYCVADISEAISFEKSNSIPCSFCRGEPWANDPSTPAPLPPALPAASTTMTDAPFCAA